MLNAAIVLFIASTNHCYCYKLAMFLLLNIMFIATLYQVIVLIMIKFTFEAILIISNNTD